jgi:hypothetical protein
MIKNISRIEHVIGERIYHFLCDSDSPITEVKECLNLFIKHLEQVEEAALKAAEMKADEEKKSSEIFEEEKTE